MGFTKHEEYQNEKHIQKHCHNLKGQRSYKHGNSNQIMRTASVPVHIYWMYTSTNSLMVCNDVIVFTFRLCAEMICVVCENIILCVPSLLNISCGIHVTDIFFCVFILFNISAGVRRSTFTFMHLADAFIQSNLQCIQAIHLYCQYVFPGK